MNVTKEWLISRKACKDGSNWFVSQTKINGVDILKELIKLEKYQYGIWLMLQLLEEDKKTIEFIKEYPEFTKYKLNEICGLLCEYNPKYTVKKQLEVLNFGLSILEK